MRTLIHLAVPALIVFVAVGCHQHSTSQKTSVAKVAPPVSATDTQAWESYMVKVSHADLKTITAKPYLFEVLAPADPAANQRDPDIQRALTDMARTDQYPGNAIAVAGPDPKTTADVLVAAFGAAKPGALKGLTVLYIGDASDKARVEKTITASGAAFRFADM